MGLSPATFCTWGPGTGETPFGGAAQFTAASDSTITLTSRVPNIFGNDGDEIQFDIYQPTASAWTVFGSTVSPDAITINDDTITITDGTTSDSITLDASLSTSEFVTIRLIRVSDEIVCRINGFLQANTMSVIPIDIDIIGKNQDAFTYVHAARLYPNDGDYFSLASPSDAIAGTTENGIPSRLINFYLASAHDGVLLDCMSGNSGWRLEVRNVYLSACRVVFSVGNGTDTPTELQSEIITAGKWYAVEVNLEILEGEPDAGDTTIEGFDPHTSNFYFGTERSTSNYFDGKLQSILFLDHKITSSEWSWWQNSGALRSLSEIGASTTIASAGCTNGWHMNEDSGSRSDIYGSEDLTEVPGTTYSATSNNGGFETWTSSTDLGTFSKLLSGTTTLNRESSVVNSGTYAARFDVDSSGSVGKIIDYTSRVAAGRVYNMSVYAAISDISGSPTFRFYQGTQLKSFTFSSTSYVEYTHQFTAEDAAQSIRLETNSGNANDSVYFDDLTIQADNIVRELGLRSSFLNAASFTGYLRDVKLVASAGTVNLPLYDDANDIGGDTNNGTATSVTFVNSDPTGS